MDRANTYLRILPYLARKPNESDKYISIKRRQYNYDMIPPLCWDYISIKYPKYSSNNRLKYKLDLLCGEYVTGVNQYNKCLCYYIFQSRNYRLGLVIDYKSM